MRPGPEEKFTPFMTALCFGRIEEELILPYPKTEPKDAELLKNVLGSIGQLLRPHEKDFRAWDRAGDLPAAFIEELRQFGLFSLVVPEAYGGMGMNATAYSRTLQEMLDRRPEEVIRLAVKGMLPRNRLGRAQLRKLKVYAGPEHPHAAQKPEPMEVLA